MRSNNVECRILFFYSKIVGFRFLLKSSYFLSSVSYTVIKANNHKLEDSSFFFFKNSEFFNFTIFYNFLKIPETSNFFNFQILDLKNF